jgi:hypothetical protein
LTFLPAESRWQKFTMPDGCGLIVGFADGCPLLLPSTPLQYLKRIHRELLAALFYNLTPVVEIFRRLVFVAVLVIFALDASQSVHGVCGGCFDSIVGTT